VSESLVLVNGEPVDEPDRSADRLLGLTVFDTIAVEEGRPLHLDAHLERLARGARTVGLGPVGGWEAVDEAIEQVLANTELARAVLRVSLHARGEPVGLHMEDRQADVRVSLAPARYGDLSEGVAAVTSTIQAPGEAWPAHVKAPCLPRTMAHREARGRNAFEGLMLDGEDRVVSGTRSNVFARVDDVLLTPPSPPAFPGITRRSVHRAAGDLSIPLRVRGLPRERLDDASELVLTFTGPGIVPVVELDGEPVGDGTPGPWTRELRDRLATNGPG
jgi:branched-subunit amino acid aminotransferase/4-amino-4-deoxychorismate lyase